MVCSVERVILESYHKNNAKEIWEEDLTTRMARHDYCQIPVPILSLDVPLRHDRRIPDPL